jgi:WD40 repeat protein
MPHDVLALESLRLFTREIVHSAAFRADSLGLLMVCGTKQQPNVLFWDLNTGKRNQPFTPGALALAPVFSANRKWLAMARTDLSLEIRDATTGELVRTLAGQGAATGSLCVAFSPDDRVVALSGGNSPVFLWAVETGDPIAALHGHGAEISCLAFDTVGRRSLAAGTIAGDVIVWDVGSGQTIRALRASQVRIVALDFRLDGRRFGLIDRDGSVRLWKSPTSDESSMYRLAGHQVPVLCAAVSPDGKRIATGGEDRTVRLWETVSGVNLLTFDGLGDTVQGVPFSPDGLNLAAVSHNNTVRVWYLPHPKR